MADGFLAGHDAADPAARAALLDAHADLAEILAALLDTDAPTVAATRRAGAPGTPVSIAGYRIERVLGEGGMGTVYLAEQQTPVCRHVALKVIKLGMDTRDVLARFAREQQVLALMSHDGIARVFDAGCTQRGQPWFAMEWVDGLPLVAFADRERLDLRQRTRLFMRVCDAVQHAHQKGVVHRDLKPSNVLVGGPADAAVPKVIDFGIALATGSGSVAATLLTQPGLLLGTPDYMSPEQLAGDLAAIDTRSDVYSLGVMLYELLTGGLPFPRRLRHRFVAEAEQQTRGEVPERPSSRAAVAEVATAAARRTVPRLLARELAAGLDWVVLMAIAAEPQRRYASPRDLAADLQRYLDHEPTAAEPPRASQRLRMLVRRHHTAILVGLGVVVALLLGLTTTLWYAVQARARTREFDQLAGVVHVERALAAAQTLWPAWPENVASLRAWLERDAARLMALRPTLARTLRDLEARARSSAGTVGFARETDRFLFDTLSELARRITALDESVAPDVRVRLRWAARVEELSCTSPSARLAWRAAAAAIARADGVVAHRAYAAARIELRPQMGLLPIGMNPQTLLWEFYDLRSAWQPDQPLDHAPPVPRHDRDGSLVGLVDGGVVFVLLPGGRCALGAQAGDPRAPQFDPWARADETPRAVELAPFFLARHELTQGQWWRLTGTNPALHRPGETYDGDAVAVGSTHPLEHVDWDTCDLWLRRHGLRLPTEAEWEYGCRGGTATVWWTGDEPASLAGACNVLDRTGQRQSPSWGNALGGFDDGFTRTSAVGSFRANAFGLYDVHGNVWEWCRDVYAPATGNSTDGIPPRSARGGCFGDPAQFARSAIRYSYSPKFRGWDVGVRAARTLQ